MTGIELSAVIAFAIAGALLLLFGVFYFLAGREVRSATLRGYAVDVLIPVRSRPRLYDWDAEGDFR